MDSEDVYLDTSLDELYSRLVIDTVHNDMQDKLVLDVWIVNEQHLSASGALKEVEVTH